MSNSDKQLSNPFSTGGGGARFETQVQASFVALMLAGGFAPCLPCKPINKIKLQGKFTGYQTDDLIVFTQDFSGKGECKLLGQIKHSITITENDSTFEEVIQSAWRDFNNPDVFTKRKDVIALITGPLSVTDTSEVRTILEWARHSEDSDEFFKKVGLATFSSDAKRKKLQAFKANRKKANNNIEVPDDEAFEFLKHFHFLGYDLDIRAGVTLSLLHSLIGQYSPADAQSIWAKLLEEVQSANQSAGTLSADNIPADLLSIFKKPRIETIPRQFVIPNAPKPTRAWGDQPQVVALTEAMLVGKWNENSEPDLEIIRGLVENYNSWIGSLREVLQEQDTPLKLRNGHWEVPYRKTLWEALGSRIFDAHLDRFKNAAVEVLTELDPQFELSTEERFAASIHGKVLKHSSDLRQGMTETLALLGNYGNKLKNCSQYKPETTAVLVIHEIFERADWQLWGSLNSLLPTLAEAAPGEFLISVENALQQTPCPFDDLFAQEGNGISGQNYMTGLLWALESLAWSEEHVVRVAVILAELASHDPGGNWANRPANSLSTILLPWYPQTLAHIDKRMASIKSIRTDFPDVAWKVLLSLLPNSHQISSGAYKPRWRNILPKDWKPEVTHKEYWEQVTGYGEIAVEMVYEDLDKLKELVGNLDNLPRPSFDAVLKYLSSAEIIELPENQRMPIWTSLTNFASKHRQFSDSDWALDPEIVTKIEDVASGISPTSPEGLHRRLFSNRDFDLYEENGDWEEQHQKLDERRQQAIQKILSVNEIQGVIAFVDTVESPNQVGWALGAVGEQEIDLHLLPEYLNTENTNYRQFVSGFVWGRYQNQGWQWVDGLNRTDWTLEQNSQLLTYLPFDGDTWRRANKWLSASASMYWQKVLINPYQSANDLLFAIDKLLEAARPQAAIDCLNCRLHKELPLDSERTVRALLATVSTPEATTTLDSYNITKLIKALQNDSQTDPNDLFKVEWAYLPLLDRVRGDAEPKLLETRLATKPEFFCEVIRLVYRSINEEFRKEELNEQGKAIATNAWRLLNKWKRPPGLQQDGSFSVQNFESWLEKVKKQCTESGHLEIAMSKVGEVLFYCPADPQGLWIVHATASALNGRDAEDMRRGFRTEAYNSRGMHWIDPTGAPERALAEQWRQKADEIENAGLARFAGMLRELAESSDRQAERIVDEHKSEEEY